MIETPAEALLSGRLANPEGVMSVRQSTSAAGRAIDLRVMGGVDLRILPDRGLDIGAAWFGGVPLAWVSAVGEVGPLETLDGMAWGDTFGGGLMTTCGLRNVGSPSEGRGLHGTFSHLGASQVRVDASVELGTATVSGIIVDGDDPSVPSLRVERTISTSLGQGRVQIVDRTLNTGGTPTEAPLLYHLNFGYPLWDGRASLNIDTSSTLPRDVDSAPSLDNWTRPTPTESGPERVLEHSVVSAEGWGRANILSPDAQVAVTLKWRMAELPRLHQWIDPNPGMCVLGIEPANCSTRGRAHDREEGRLPLLEPGVTRETVLSIEARRL